MQAALAFVLRKCDSCLSQSEGEHCFKQDDAEDDAQDDCDAHHCAVFVLVVSGLTVFVSLTRTLHEFRSYDISRERAQNQISSLTK